MATMLAPATPEPPPAGGIPVRPSIDARSPDADERFLAGRSLRAGSLYAGALVLMMFVPGLDLAMTCATVGVS